MGTPQRGGKRIGADGLLVLRLQRLVGQPARPLDAGIHCACGRQPQTAIAPQRRKAKPALLEPFVEVEVTAPAQYMGDITGDLSTRRGRVQDSMVDGENCTVRAVAPLGELQNYANELKSMTHGAGSYVMDYSHDERTPPQVQAEVIAAYDPHADDD